MAVYKRGYRRYGDMTTGRWSRLMILPGYGWRALLQRRLIVSILVWAMFWPLGCLGFIYFSNHTELLLQIESGIKKYLQIDGGFFLLFMRVQAVFSLLISVFAAPGLIVPDLANNALQLYFSRPFSRAEYIFSRLLVLLGLLSLVTWIPGILLFFMQSGMAGWNWFETNWNIGLGVFIGFLLWNFLVSLVALAGSAYVKKRIIAEASILGILFILPAAAAIFNTVFSVTWASLFDPVQVTNRIWHWLLGTTPESGPTVSGSLLAVLVMTAVLLAVLGRKIRPVEVVS